MANPGPDENPLNMLPHFNADHSDDEEEEEEEDTDHDNEDDDSGNESSDIEEITDVLDPGHHVGGIRGDVGCDLMDTGSNPSCSTVDEYPCRVLSTEDVLQHMVECINEVNMIVELPPTVTRILLNHFKWDKEKLYER